MEINRIAVTGGNGKARMAALQRLQAHFEALGYAVFLLPNPGDTMVTLGIAAPEGIVSLETAIRLRQTAERLMVMTAASAQKENVLVVCDGGIMDLAAGVSNQIFAEAARRADSSVVELRDSYDAVFLTQPFGETLDENLLRAWVGTPHLRVTDSEESLVREVAFFLGVPEPLEIERKYLIEYPDLAYLEGLPNCRRVDIVQTYLQSAPNVTARVRRRGRDGAYLYYHTIKQRITDVRRVEIERRIDEEEYARLLLEADPARHPIRKSRYCLMDRGQYFELDVFPFWKDQAVLEIELNDEHTPVVFPDCLKVIREVTGEPEFSTSNLARLSALEENDHD